MTTLITAAKETRERTERDTDFFLTFSSSDSSRLKQPEMLAEDAKEYRSRLVRGS